MSTNQAVPPQWVRALIRREQLALVGRLLQGLRHNLSGAVQMIRLPLDLLEMQILQGKSPDLPTKLEALKNGAIRLDQELDLLSEMSIQFQKSEAENFDLVDLVRRQLDFWRADMYYKHEVLLQLELEGEPMPVYADYQDVALAFNCLMANALEALRAAEAKEMVLRSGREPDRVWLHLSDQGGGPAPEMLPRMFDPFVSDKGEKHEGLGLFLAREALAPWQGRLQWRQDPTPGFRLSLPPA